ncbi:MAG: hypothetical protein Q7R52_05315 [archaeon]|nr:hypothetical protein [archaeon]
MKEIFNQIWNLALPYQDKRGDKGHAEITLKYAIRLLKSEKGNKDIVIPAIILHDTGWSQLSEIEGRVIFDADATKEAKLSVRYKHQDAGVKISRKILNSIDYPTSMVDEVLEIVSQHDTREGFFSKNEGLVRDSDKLWRFSKIGFNADLIRGKISFHNLYSKLINRVETPNFLYSYTAREIAYDELKIRASEFQ